MPDFRTALADGGVHIFDGAYGTLLQSRGLPSGMSPEIYGLKNPETVEAVHRDYRAAGARVLTTNTFGASRFKLPAEVDVAELNRAMTALARNAAGDACFVAGSVGPTGKFARPLGPVTMAEMVEAYKEQIRAIAEGGADLVLAETHFDLAEARAVVLAAREVCDLPVGVSMTFEDGTCLTGTGPLTFVDTMQNMGVELVATNCSAGPEQILEVVEAMLPRLDAPLLVQANAGLPELDSHGETVFRLGPAEFAAQSARFAELGAKFIGGCCGTGPDHIRALDKALNEVSWKRPEPPQGAPLVLTSRTTSVPFAPGLPAVVIGERINPTGKKTLAKELASGVFTEALRLAAEQESDGARVLDVNVGAAMVDEKAVLPQLTETLVSRLTLPLCLDSNDADALEAGLWAYPGSALINSVSGEPGRMERLGPLCRDHGAPFILLPLEGRKLPVTAAERIGIIERLLDEALALGVPKRLVMVDVLALTVSSKPEAAKACFETIRHCAENLGLPTTMGLSNISFGLPARELINASFLAMSMANGLAGCIANPGSNRLMETLASCEVLLNRDPQAESYIANYQDWTPAAPAEARGGGGSRSRRSGGRAETPGQAVVKGDKDRVISLVEAELDKGADPFDLVNDELIPAIMEVGDKYERKEYFLPQLILSAETLKSAIARLEPLLQESGRQAARKVAVMATVEGDIHDIGKNIVCLMLANHGFEVVDLGKDVAAKTIVDKARETNASVIGLSALMTTTMVRMEDTVKLVREQGLSARVMVGGAVLTQEFADSIGADAFARDAVAAVKLAKELSD